MEERNMLVILHFSAGINLDSFETVLITTNVKKNKVIQTKGKNKPPLINQCQTLSNYFAEVFSGLKRNLFIIYLHSSPLFWGYDIADPH